MLVDHQMVPDGDDIDRWLRDIAARGARTARTNALFPAAAEVFADAGFSPIDTLALLELDLTTTPGTGRPGRTTRRLRSTELAQAAEIDRRSFGDDWSNDADSLAEVSRATPQHRDRVVRERGRIVAFAISGRAGRTGYIQRLAVDPASRRRGHARTLVDDALAWLGRRSVSTVLVNTATDNEAALSLYRSAGFRQLDDPLVLMERAVAAPTS